MPVYSDIDINLEKQTDGDILIDKEFDAIHNSIYNIFTTFKGERRMLPTFGSNIYQFLFEPIDEVTAYSIGEEIYNALTYWETRIVLEKIKVIPDSDNSLFDISIQYYIKEKQNILKEFNYILKRS